MQRGGHTNWLGQGSQEQECSDSPMREGPGSGSRRAREVRKGRMGETQAGTGGRARQLAPQPTGHSRPPKGKGNVRVWKGKQKERGKETLFSLRKTSHIADGEHPPKCCTRTRRLRARQTRGRSMLAGLPPTGAPACKGWGCPELKLWDHGGDSKYDCVHQTKG